MTPQETKGSARRDSEQGKVTSDLMTRTLTGAVFAVVFMLCIGLSMISATILITALSAFCAYEFYRMMRSDAKLPNMVFGTIVSAAYPVVYFFFQLHGLFWLTLVFLVVELCRFVIYPRLRIVDVSVTVFGALYIGLLLTSLLIIRGSFGSFTEFGIGTGGFATLLVVISVWVNDAFAYLVGSRFGKHKMAPRISPKKSWEGVIAGFVGGIIIWLFAPLIPGFEIGYGMAVVAALLCGIAGILGDLAESRIKRGCGCKDSGNILPGHGGFLDRCDSIILVAPTALAFLSNVGALTSWFLYL